MSEKQRITIARGDGIGPEIMEATLKILEKSGARIDYDEIEIGEKVYLEGFNSGMKPEAWDTLLKNKIFLKAPITTPQGGGFKSLNVTIRKTLGLFANVRPVTSYPSVISSRHPQFDMVIVRENEEDLYAGIEHRQTQEVYQCLKLITKPGSDRIIRYAFEYARNNGRKKVSCFVKDNIMKLTDGIFHRIFDEVSKEYPDIESDHYIVDIGAARIADTPEWFDVCVMPNLYGDILSDIAAQISGSVGLCGSANIGMDFGMFEAIHGSAPDIAGQGIANPSGLLNGAIIMLSHIGQGDVARNIHNAWLKTLEDGVHTGDIFNEAQSRKKANTKEFAEAVVDRLGEKPKHLLESKLGKSEAIVVPDYTLKEECKTFEGVDIFLEYHEDRNPEVLAERLNAASHSGDFTLKMITNRGVKVWPEGRKETFCSDHWRCRFVAQGNEAKVYKLMQQIEDKGLDVIKTENLYSFDGAKGYSVAQGE